MDIRIFVLFCTLLGGMGQGVVMPNLPRLLHESNHLAIDSGLSATLMYLGIFLSTFKYGKMADQGKVHLLLSLGLFGYAASLVLLSVITYPYFIFAVRFLEGLAISAVYVGADFVLGRVSKPNERGRWLSYYGVALSVGLIFGPLLVLAMQKIVSNDSPQAPMLTVAIIAVILGAFSIQKKVAAHEAPASNSHLNLSALSCGTVYGYLEAGLVAVFPVLALTKFQVTTEYCLIVMILSAALFSIFWGELADKKGSKNIIKILILILAFGPLALIASSVFITPAWIAYTSCVLFGILAGGLYPVGFNWLLESIPESQYGYASGAFARAYGLGSIVGPLLSGFISENWSYNGLFLSFSLLGIGSVFWLRRNLRAH